MLLEKIEECLVFGYRVSFRNYTGQVYIELEDQENDNHIEQALTLSDHFTEKKIVDCINHMIDKLRTVDQDSYQGVLADEVLYKYRDGKLYWYGKDQRPVTLQEMDITRLKRTKAWLENSMEEDNTAMKNWLVCFSNEINLRMLKDFKI